MKRPSAAKGVLNKPADNKTLDVRTQEKFDEEMTRQQPLERVRTWTWAMNSVSAPSRYCQLSFNKNERDARAGRCALQEQGDACESHHDDCSW